MLSQIVIGTNKDIITSQLLQTKRKGMTQLLAYMEVNGFFTAPASRSYHQNYEGGLAEHSVGVLYRTTTETKTIESNRVIEPSSIVISALLHDLCKIDQYVIVTKDDKGMEHEPNIISNKEANWEHATKSINIAKRFITLTEEEEYAIRYHMGIYSKDFTWNEFGEAIKKYPLVYLIHVADMKDTYNI